jgi:signal transduction histidine kinase
MDEQQQNFYNEVLIVVLLIGVIIIYFVVTIIRYHRRYIKLQRERILAEITIQENERKRIANDLHDSLGPLLSSVKLNINSVDVHNEGDEKLIDKAGKHIDEIIKSIRQISHNLLPNTLERKGLIEALREFTRHINEEKIIRIQLHEKAYPQIAKEKEIHIFRMIQEIVNNTIKHAGAKNLQIGFSEEENNILILTKDDGVGFDVKKIRATSGGLGLKSIESRTEILNGKLVIESELEKGTSYIIKIPL